MPPPTENASGPDRLIAFVARMAPIYDRFAHCLDPGSKESAEAEKVFFDEIAWEYDLMQPPKPAMDLFRYEVVRRCKLFLIAADKRTTVPPKA